MSPPLPSLLVPCKGVFELIAMESVVLVMVSLLASEESGAGLWITHLWNDESRVGANYGKDMKQIFSCRKMLHSLNIFLIYSCCCVSEAKRKLG